MGKVFWAGALVSMGGRDPRGGRACPARARPQGARAPRPARRRWRAKPNTASGMCSCRTSATRRSLVPHAPPVTAQPPRGSRSKAGERAEDLADVLAHHYQSSARARPRRRQRGHAQSSRRERSATSPWLASGRSRSTSTGRAASRRRPRARSRPATPRVPRCWSAGPQAAQQQGRLQEAREALEQALLLYRDLDEPVGAGRVLTRLGLVLHRLGDARADEVLGEAVQLLEAQPAGPELVSAHAYIAGWNALTDHFAESIAAAERARALAEELGLPEPAFALHWRGLARSALGDADGVADMRRALQLALEQGLGRETAVIYGNLSAASWFYRGQRPRSPSAARRSSSVSGAASPSSRCRCAPPPEPPGGARTTPSRRSQSSGRPPTESRQLATNRSRTGAASSCACSRNAARRTKLPTPTSSSPPPAQSASAKIASALADAAQLLLARDERRARAVTAARAR